MIHNIAHCEGGGGLCPRRENCIRFLASEEAKKEGLIVPYVVPLYGETRCVYYLPKENQDV